MSRNIFFKIRREVLRPFLRRKRRRAYREMLEQKDYRDRFESIYANRFWSSAESISGTGSTKEFTHNLRGWLPRVVSQHGIMSIVDAPCGDFNWMKLILPQMDVTYTGLDIVEALIAQNKAEHGGARIRFAVADICADPLPPCDLLIVRDCLFHLSFADIERFLHNVAGLEYKYLLTTTHLVGPDHVNHDIATGDFRLIDLTSAPFCFPADRILDRVKDYPEGHNVPREMILLPKSGVPTALRRPS